MRSGGYGFESLKQSIAKIQSKASSTIGTKWSDLSPDHLTHYGVLCIRFALNIIRIKIKKGGFRVMKE